MTARVATAQAFSPEVQQFAERVGLAAGLAELEGISQRLFPGPLGVVLEHDPEWPDAPMITFSVHATGDCREIIDRECQWHEAVRVNLPDALPHVRLSIDPR